jgi:DNA-binding NtrC family response regulator
MMKPRILTVDDDVIMRDMLNEYLTEVGYDVDVSDGVSTALSLIESNEYEIILLDKNMPSMDGKSDEGGMDILRYVRAHMIPAEVIMMTGYATIDTAIESMKLGAFDYILKPFPLKEIKERIERLLEYRRFFDSTKTIKIYRGIQGEIFSLIEKKSTMSDSELEASLKALNNKIDKLFMLFKECERFALNQREALAKIASYAEQLEENFSDAEQSQKLLGMILKYSGNRI